ncbi:Hsp70 family protein, partial [Belnapia sp. T6]
MTLTLSALFDSHAKAALAVQALVSEAGVNRSSVRVEAGSSTNGSAASDQETRDLFASLRGLFIPDQDKHTYLEGMRRGGTLVVAQVEKAQLDRAMDVLAKHGAVDLDEHEATWRRQGWTGGNAAVREDSSVRKCAAITDLVAIDFGTTRTKLAYFDGSGPELMRFGERDLPYAPSLFHLPAGGEQIHWGWDAEFKLDEEPEGIVAQLKQVLRETKVRAGNRRWAPPASLLAAMLSDLRTRAADIAAFGGRQPARVRLTRPVLFGPADERVMRQAAGMAGFTEVEFIDEPVAAARAWAEVAGTKAGVEAVVVLDCGGGTVDGVLLRRDVDGSFRTAPECPPWGDLRVGGRVLDNELLRLVKDLLEDQGDVEAVAAIDAQPMHYLGRVRTMKESIGRGGPMQVRIGNRVVPLESKAVAELFEQRFSVQICDGLAGYLETARASFPSSVTPSILMVGGAARLRGFKETVERRLGCPTLGWDRSDYATALGAVLPSADETRVKGQAQAEAKTRAQAQAKEKALAVEKAQAEAKTRAQAQAKEKALAVEKAQA